MILDAKSIHSALLRTSNELLDESEQSAIVLDLNSLESLSDDVVSQVEQWYKQQPCPIVGFGSSQSTTTRCVDVVVESEKEVKTVLRRIGGNSQAATVLVQVLRTVEGLPYEDGLVIESLGYSTLQAGQEFKQWLATYQSKKPVAPHVESGEPVLLDRKGNQLTITLNRPENNNSYTVEMRDALVDSIRFVQLDKDIREVYVKANGRSFCSGGELTEFGSVSSPTLGHLVRSQISPARLLLSMADRFHFHLHGACVGSGIEIPACAGKVTADSKTVFWLPELAMGLIPGAGGCVSISRRIGRHKTAYMVLMNKKISAEKALEWGLIDDILEHGE